MLDALKNELKEMIIDKLGLEDVNQEDIENDAALFDDSGLGLDSVDALELGLAVQKRYGIKMDNESTELRAHFYSINALAQWIHQEGTA
ncbi:phosphopantetheine-binding protein [Suttonella sp. R2A3]|uniref:phosphopantetheine-binding protein n=1 Tax=Suttonella sp. R2A3 TaxID=2908648 RepID=UPI001EEC9A13|nr:phosphopantetheine-binding protein [Suttonella sp. R2A3]UJF23661.1 phosphopantetheine-binding protein [Suttonella sp. R2A3]